MHEYAIISALFDQIENQARLQQATRVTHVTVELGLESGVDRELFATAFTIFRERTICEGAELTVHSTAAAWCCPKCKTAIAAGSVLRCPRCQVPAKLARGDEIILQRIEMEVGDV